jgi:hypothetical protein
MRYARGARTASILISADRPPGDAAMLTMLLGLIFLAVIVAVAYLFGYGDDLWDR